MLRSGPRKSHFVSTAFTLLELLVVIAIIGLLAGLLMPALSAGRSRGTSAKCAANLRSVGQAITAFAAAHNDEVAPVIRDRDYYWDRGEQIGWDIAVGRWADIIGGSGTIWQCPQQKTAFVGNARALGLDNRQAISDGLLHRVGPRLWTEPSRIALAYDLQSNLLDNLYQHARDPAAGDLSDEWFGGWPRGQDRVVVPLALDRWGPHRGAYGVLFADGHSKVGKFNSAVEATLWVGPRWWPNEVRDSGSTGNTG